MCLARWINWPDTLKHLTDIDISNFNTVGRVLHALSGEGTNVPTKAKIWGNAYIVSTNGHSIPKVQYLVDFLLPAAYNALGAGKWHTHYPYPPTLAARHSELMGVRGLASFMAAQVVADLKNTDGHPLSVATDWWTWCAPGPGSLRGLAWACNYKVTPGQFHPVAQELYGFIRPRLVLDKLNMQDFQNCLCEYDKFMRVLHNTGKSKRGYSGTREE